MTLPPALAAVLVLELLGAVALLVAMAGALQVAAGWAPEGATAGQLALERTAEEVSITGRAAFFLFCGADVLLVVAINHVLPAIVPGAMCGQGVLESIPGGLPLLALRAAALAGFWAWWTLDSMDRRDALGPFAPTTARLLLAAGALGLVASLRTASALLSLDTARPVSCCALVVDLARAAPGAGAFGAAGTAHVVAMALLGAGLLRAFLAPPRTGVAAAGAVAAAVAWCVLAEWVLVDVAAPYHYGLVGHRCPFCLFLRPQHFVGYLLHGTALAVVLSSVRLAVTQRALAVLPRMAAQERPSARWGAAALLVHTGASFLPALCHWLGTGTSITGAALPS